MVQGLPLTTELYEEMGAGVWLVVEAAGPEVLKGPRELSAMASCGSCVCALEEADVGESAGQRRETGLCWARRGDTAGGSRVWGFM